MSKVVFISLFVGLLLLLLAMRWYGRQPDRELFIPCLSEFTTTDSLIALTFDDGPSATITPALLNLLSRHSVKASFFVNGIHLQKHPEIARRIVAEGHQIANHSFAHDRMVFKSPAFVKADLAKTDQLLLAAGAEQEDLRFFRPPFGDSFLVLPWVLRQMGKISVGWSAEAHSQYDRELDKEKLVSETLAQCRPGAIILLHDGWSPDPRQFLEAVDQIVSTLKQKGYSFVPLRATIPHPISK